MMIRWVSTAVLLVLALVLPGCSRPADPATPVAIRTIRVAAAADLRFAMGALMDGFARVRPGIKIEPTYGSSGNFYAQLRNRAPFDLFLSADLSYPQRLEEESFAHSGDLFVYAVGHVVVWAPRSAKLNVAAEGIDVLKKPEVRHIAIANPEHAPYGRAAEGALRSLHVYDALKPKLVYGENVAQTLQFVQSGAADVGLIALSLALAPEVKKDGDYWEIPSTAYPKMEQGGIILKWASDADAAGEFRKYLLSADGRKTLAQYGFFVSGE